ncbi:pisatin demethylase [Penicillium angulare]|uniref:Pisatin demethylase n=1 Tax=Penicillium angulare TaxID=116970 RepID=A0A9W9FUV2_9EURO|nr:pisatin demethylase [Penicillium angulare]
MVSIESLAVFAGILYLFYLIKVDRKLAAYPGPTLARYTDWWKVYRHWKGDYVDVMLEWHNKHGPFIRNGPNSISVGGVENAKKVYQTNPVLNKGSLFKTMVLWYKGKSISGLEAILDENEHTAVKRMLLKGFTPNSVATYESKIDQVTLEFVNQVGKRGNFDAGEWFVYYFADMMNDIAFSAKPGFMEHGIDVDGSLHITKVITKMWARVHAIPTIMSWLSWTMGFLVGMNWKIVRLGRECLNTRLEKPDSQKIDLLNLYIEAGEQRPDMISPERVLGMTLSTIIGGSDITAFTVTYGLSEIVKNRDILDKIEREMKQASEMQELSYPPTLKELAKLPYLNGIIKESLRLAAPVQFNLDRVTPPDGLEMSGTLVPGGTTVGCIPGVINHDESVFGSDLDIFRPERWAEASQENVSRMDRGLMTFGMGKHLCIGQHFAIAQMRKIIATLLMHFEVSATDPKAKLVWFSRTFLRHPGEPFYLTVKPRESVLDVSKS